MFYHGCIKLNILWLALLFLSLFKGILCFLSCTARFSYSRTTFVFCILLHPQISSLIVIKSKALRDYALLCAFAVLIFHLFGYLSIRTHIFPQYNRLCHDFSSKFICHPDTTFLFFKIVGDLLSSFEFSPLHLLQCLCKNLPYSLALNYFYS